MSTFLLPKQNLCLHKDIKMFLHGTNMPTGMFVSRICLSRSEFLWDDIVVLISMSEVWLFEFLPSKMSLTNHFIYTVLKRFIRKLLFGFFFFPAPHTM